MPTFCQFGKDYAGARDDYVYSYSIRLQDASGLKVQKPGLIDCAASRRTNLWTEAPMSFSPA